MRKVLILLAAIGITGCTTTPVSTDKATDIPFDRVFNKSLLQTGPGRGAVIIKRDSGHVGNMCYSKLYLDGKEIAQIDVAEKLVFHPSIGDHLIGAYPGICGGSLSEASIKVETGKTILYRIGYDSGVIYGLRPTAF
ncbi:hypothetical protein [Erwinia sp. MYb416]|uniref:hypothetical protein n=1 Tax=Erwinia sp. MYb416 TaxID=3108532 RepID=UPI0030A881E3